MTTTTIEGTMRYPQGFPQLLKMSEDAFLDELRFLGAAKLYELGKLSAGKAAELTEMNKLDFFQRLATVNIPAINLQDEQIDVELANALDLHV